MAGLEMVRVRARLRVGVRARVKGGGRGQDGLPTNGPTVLVIGTWLGVGREGSVRGWVRGWV